MNENDRTLWMGDLEDYMDANFIGEAFARMGEEVQTVKTVFDKYSGRAAGYCFVEMKDGDSARRAMLNVNGKVIPKSKPPVTFNLSFANSPHAPYTEYNLFVNNVPYDLDDAGLFLVFGERYRSCRGAKVYRNNDGSSKGLGFVRFADQTDQQRALVEMNKFRVRGTEIILKLAQPKTRGPRFGGRFGDRGQQQQQQHYDPTVYYPQYSDYYNSAAWQMYDLQGSAGRGGYRGNRNDYGGPSRRSNYQSAGGPSRSGGSSSSHHRSSATTSAVEDKRRKRTVATSSASLDPDLDQEPYIADDPIEDQNDRFMEDSEELYQALESSKWNPTIMTAAVTQDELLEAILNKAAA